MDKEGPRLLRDLGSFEGLHPPFIDLTLMSRRGAVHCLHAYRVAGLETDPRHQQNYTDCHKENARPVRSEPQESHAAPWRLQDAWRAPKRILDAHPPDQSAQLRVDLRRPSLWARLPTPVAAKTGPMPTKERLGPDDCENLQDCRKPAIQLDKEPAIMVREPDATMPPAPQDNQLMSKHCVLSLKPHLRLEWRGQDGQDETEQSDHSASLGDSTTS